MTQVRIRPLAADGTASGVMASRVAIRLVDRDGQPMIGLRTPDGAPVTTYHEHEIAADGTPWVVDLTPQSAIGRADGAESYYQVEIRAGHRHEPWRVQVPDSGAVLELADLVGASAIAPADLLAGRLLPTPADEPDNRWLRTLDGAWVSTAAPAGSGDMQALTYDPAGVAANCFDAGNLAGTFDAGTFT
jgi:hypothetical protein